MVDDPTRTPANSFYKDDGYVVDLPWLYYRDGSDFRDATEVLREPGRVKFRSSFGLENLEHGIVKYLRFRLVEYDIEGNMRATNNEF